MPLYDASSCPHTVTIQSVTSGVDAGGGVQLTFATAQSGVPCWINTVGSNEREMYSQQAIVVTHTVSVLASALTTVPARGWKLLSDRSESFHVHGIRHTRNAGTVPPFVHLDVEMQL